MQRKQLKEINISSVSLPEVCSKNAYSKVSFMSHLLLRDRLEQISGLLKTDLLISWLQVQHHWIGKKWLLPVIFIQILLGIPVKLCLALSRKDIMFFPLISWKWNIPTMYFNSKIRNTPAVITQAIHCLRNTQL